VTPVSSLRKAALSPLRHFHQHLVPDGVPQGVVDGLEMVKIEDHDCQLFPAPLCQAKRVFEAVVEQRTIGQAGKLVEMRQIFNALLISLFFGDVFLDCQVVCYPAISLAYRRDRCRLDVFRAILAAD